MLKRAEKREIDNQFTELCLERLYKAHDYAQLIAKSKEQHMESLSRALGPGSQQEHESYGDEANDHVHAFS